MGFIFLTLAIYQAEAAWWGEREGSNSPTTASAQQGNRWFMVPLPFHITLCVSCLFPSLPAVVRLLPPLSTNILTYSIKPPSFLAHSLWLCPAPHYSPLFPLLHLLFFIALLSSSSSSCVLQPPPLPLCLPFLYLNSICSLCYRTLGTTAPCTSPRWQPFTWGTTAAMPMAMKTSIRLMCCRWMVSSGSFLTYSVGRSVCKMF